MGVFTSCLTRVFPRKGGIAAQILPLNFGVDNEVNDQSGQTLECGSGFESLVVSLVEPACNGLGLAAAALW